MNALMIAAPSSGAGKTTVTLGLLRALARDGVGLCPAKAGPDYIDPAFHAAASGVACHNLDPWAMRRDLLLAHAMPARHGHVTGQKLLVVEAMMGLFDATIDGTGSAADLASVLKLPVILVVDGSGMSHSAGALVDGFCNHRSDVSLAGVIFNQVVSERHEAMLRQGVEKTGVPVVGAIRRDHELALPSRHLGLVQAAEHDELQRFIDKAADRVEAGVDLVHLMALATRFPVPGTKTDVRHLAPLGQHIAVARDPGFAFCYEHILSGWRQEGAQTSFFSPLADEAPSPDADAVYLPGGYPELHAGQIAQAENFSAGMQLARRRGASIYGECGGYMVLGEALIDAGGSVYPMLGFLPVTTSFAAPQRHLGYRRLEALSDFPWPGSLMAHEFHYASVVREEPDGRLFTGCDAAGHCLGAFGHRRGQVAGSFMHVIDMAEDNTVFSRASGFTVGETC